MPKGKANLVKTEASKTSLALSLALFALTLVLAVAEQWDAGDIVWSMWLASLITGYILILLTAIVGTLMVSGRMMSDKKKRRAKDLSSGRTESVWQTAGIQFSFFGIGCFALFILGFITLHFVGFHIAHAAFLNNLFPLEAPVSSGAVEGPQLLWPYFKIIVATYWPFLAISLMLFAPRYWRVIRDKEMGGPMEPYGAVVRNHVTIIAIGGLQALGSPKAILYLVIVVYFFPWSILWKNREESRANV